jgi:hypothetical protein
VLNARVGRWLLDTFPTWLVALVGVGGFTAASLVGFSLYRRLRLRAPDTGADTMVSSFAARAHTLLGILLVFVIVSLYGSFLDARSDVEEEATNLAQVVRDSRAFPSQARAGLQARAVAYAREVREREWPLMTEGDSSDRALALLDGLYARLAD